MSPSRPGSFDSTLPLDSARPFELETYLEQVPAGARVRAMAVLNSSARSPKASVRAPWLNTLTPFQWIPLRDYLEIVWEVSQHAVPGGPALEAVRRHARGIYPSFRETVFGEAIFKALDRDIHEILRHISIAYTGVYSDARVRVVDLEAQSATFVYDELYGFAGNMIAAGALEGVLDLCGVTGEVRVAEHGLGSGDVFVRWQG